MQRYVVTGAPGAGKTSVLRELGTYGFTVVSEAATDVIAREQQRGVDEPWRDKTFLDKITRLQLERMGQECRQQRVPPEPARAEPARADGVQLHDRSVLCTLALARFLGYEVPPLLAAEVARVTRQRLFEPAVFLVRPLGFIEATAARRISYAETLEFQMVHEAVYAEHGFELIDIPPAPVVERAATIAGHIADRRTRRTSPGFRRRQPRPPPGKAAYRRRVLRFSGRPASTARAGSAPPRRASSAT